MPRADRFATALQHARKAALLAGPAAILVSAGAASAATVGPSHAPATAGTQLSAALRGRGPVAILDAAWGKPRHAAGTRAAPHRVAEARVRSRRRSASRHHGSARHVPLTWNQVARVQAHRADPGLGRGPLPAADQLQPVSAFGPQQYMPLTSAQVGNAATIVKQALIKKMGVRSAVVAVATAMQESGLNNINYGTSDSLGLFQQRPSCGWGTPQQIMDPAYAANAFLAALQKYQAADPAWASQPLYQAAQGVQASAFPTAYAKWEAQSAGLVKAITTNLTS